MTLHDEEKLHEEPARTAMARALTAALFVNLIAVAAILTAGVATVSALA